ncbi:MAG: HEAT repeat domain-containing protein [Verrucomicrobia bacterium]|nr:HEAT repeat domain-containing protein [Verrucomicrobiota bacterium]
MQHHGWLEALLTARFAKQDLVFRNLGYSGDEVGGFLDSVPKDDKNSIKTSKAEAEAAAAQGGKLDKNLRNRSENFGSNDDWLKMVKADVIFAFFGFNESFAGDAGLAKFKGDLGTFLKETAGKNYSGKGAPRVVLFGPLAAEKSSDPNLPDPTASNANLQKYSAAMAEVAKAAGVPFVELFKLSQQAYADAAKKKQALTFDTVHLTEAGDQAFAPEIFRALTGESAPSGNHEKLRAAINEKNAEWHHRYRTVDGYNVYGGRSGLAFQAGVKPFKSNLREPEPPLLSNFQTMQDEMNQRDALTANRDKRVWAVAKGGDLKLDDSNLPKARLLPASNLTNDMPYLSGEETIKHITAAKGCKITLVADEVKFPELVSPVQMSFDPQGRLWIAAWPSYPEVAPTDKVKDKLLIFDLGADGKPVKCTTWLDGLNCPTGFQFHKDGVLVMQAPDLWFVHGADGKAGARERVVMGMDSADSHHTANSICYEPGGAVYLSDGVFHRTQVETAAGAVRNIDGGVYRYEPLSHRFERYVAYGFANPHGRVFDYWGNDFITDATGNANYFAPAFSGAIDFPAKHPKLQLFWKNPSRPCPATAILSSRHFPGEFQGNFLNFNVIGFQGIYRAKFSEDGAGIKGESIEDLLKGDNAAIPNFRPICGAVAPDGSFYFCDWAKPLIGHMQHHIRDPKRDKSHGRIYRMTFEGRPLLKPVKIAGESIEKLLEVLKTPEDDVRTRAKIELSKHDSAKVIAATKKWAASLNKSDKDYAHNLTEALWVHQWHNVVDEALLKQVLRSPDYRARAAATRVLCYWRDRVKDPLALLKPQATDENPRVRLEAIRACSFFQTSKAAEVALSALEKEANPDKPDYYIKYCLDETMKQLGKFQ